MMPLVGAIGVEDGVVEEVGKVVEIEEVGNVGKVEKVGEVGKVGKV